MGTRPQSLRSSPQRHSHEVSSCPFKGKCLRKAKVTRRTLPPEVICLGSAWSSIWQALGFRNFDLPLPPPLFARAAAAKHRFSVTARFVCRYGTGGRTAATVGCRSGYRHPSCEEAVVLHMLVGVPMSLARSSPESPEPILVIPLRAGMDAPCVAAASKPLRKRRQRPKLAVANGCFYTSCPSARGRGARRRRT